VRSSPRSVNASLPLRPGAGRQFVQRRTFDDGLTDAAAGRRLAQEPRDRGFVRQAQAPRARPVPAVNQDAMCRAIGRERRDGGGEACRGRTYGVRREELNAARFRAV
jgi:hypothetical protein